MLGSSSMPRQNFSQFPNGILVNLDHGPFFLIRGGPERCAVFRKDGGTTDSSSALQGSSTTLQSACDPTMSPSPTAVGDRTVGPQTRHSSHVTPPHRCRLAHLLPACAPRPVTPPDHHCHRLTCYLLPACAAALPPAWTDRPAEHVPLVCAGKARRRGSAHVVAHTTHLTRRRAGAAVMMALRRGRGRPCKDMPLGASRLGSSLGHDVATVLKVCVF